MSAFRHARIELRHRFAITTALCGGLLLASPSLAQSIQYGDFGSVQGTNGTVGNPTITLDGAGTGLTVSAGQNAIVNWERFEVPTASHTANFVNENGGAAPAISILNRVTGGTVTNIRGALSSDPNVNLYVINPNGVVFSSTAAVNVGSLVTSTLGVTDADFLDGDGSLHFSGPLGATSGIQIDAGALIDTNGVKGQVVLVAPRIVSNGVIDAWEGGTDGDVALVAATDVNMALGNGPITMTINRGTALNTPIATTGRIEGHNVTIAVATQQSVTDALLGAHLISRVGSDANGGIVIAAGGSAGGVTIVNSADTDGTVNVDAAYFATDGTSGGGHITTAANGAVAIDFLQSNADTAIEAGSDISINGNIFEVRKLDLTAGGNVSVRDVSGSGTVNIASSNGVITTGVISTGQTPQHITIRSNGPSGQISVGALTGRDIHLSSGNGVNINANVFAQGNLTVTSGNLTSLGSISATDITFDIASTASIAGAVNARGDYVIDAYTIRLGGGSPVAQTASGNVVMTAGNGGIQGGAGLTLLSGRAATTNVDGQMILTSDSGLNFSSTSTILSGQSGQFDLRLTAAPGTATLFQFGDVLANALHYRSDTSQAYAAGIQRAGAIVLGDVQLNEALSIHSTSRGVTVGNLDVTGVGQGITINGAGGAVATGLLWSNGAIALANGVGGMYVEGATSANGGITANSAGTVQWNSALSSRNTINLSGLRIQANHAGSSVSSSSGDVVIAASGGSASVEDIAGRGVAITATGQVSVHGDVTAAGDYSVSGSIVDLGVRGGRTQSAAGNVNVTSTTGNIRGFSGLTLLSGSGASTDPVQMTLTSAGGFDFDETSSMLSGPNGEFDLLLTTGSSSAIFEFGDITANALLHRPSPVDSFSSLVGRSAISIGNLALQQGVTLSSVNADLKVGDVRITGGSFIAQSDGAGATTQVGNVQASGEISLLSREAITAGDLISTSHRVTLSSYGGTTAEIAVGDVQGTSVWAAGRSIAAGIVDATAGTILFNTGANAAATAFIDVQDVNATSDVTFNTYGQVLSGNIATPGSVWIAAGDVELNDVNAATLVLNGIDGNYRQAANSVVNVGMLHTNGIRVGSIALGGANSIGQILGALATGDIIVNDRDGGLLLSSTINSSSGNIDIRTAAGGLAGGALTMSSGSVVGGNIVSLSTDRNLVNNSGAGAIAANQWAIYTAAPAERTSGNPDGNFYNGLDSDNNAVWGGTAASRPISGLSGNRYVFAYQPTATFTAESLTKTYGTTVTPGYSVVTELQGGIAGAFRGDTLADVFSGTPLLASAGGAERANVGTYAVTVDGSGLTSNAGYRLVFVDGLITVNPKALTGTFTANDKVYDGSTAATGTVTGVTGILSGDDVVITGTGVFADKNVGTGKLVNATGATLSGAQSGNYTITVTGSDTADITPMAVTATVAPISKTYDGTTAARPVAITINGVLAGDDLSASGGIFTYADKNAGTSKSVSITGVVIAGSDAGNYLVALPSTVLGEILRKELTLNVSANGKTYDGTTNATGQVNGIVGVVGTDQVVIENAVFAFADKNAGDAKAVSMSANLGGADAGNYTLALPANLAADIARKLLTITVSVDGKIYDGTTSATGSVSGLTGVVAGDVVDVAGDGHYVFADANAGAGKNVNVTGLHVDGADAANYTVQIGPAIGDIARRAITVQANNATKIASAPDPVFTYAIVDGTLVGSDGFTGALGRVAGEQPGLYDITQGSLNLSSNYELTFLAGQLEIQGETARPQYVLPDLYQSIELGGQAAGLRQKKAPIFWLGGPMCGLDETNCWQASLQN